MQANCITVRGHSYMVRIALVSEWYALLGIWVRLPALYCAGVCVCASASVCAHAHVHGFVAKARRVGACEEVGVNILRS